MIRKTMRVAVIGAGASGLPAIKTALEHKFEVVCFEKSNDIGGLWRYKPHQCDGEGTVMRSTVINTCKEMTAYSDFPPPKDAANYMHNSELLKYFRSYADHFDLVKHIRFRHEVLQIERTDKFKETGKWRITYNDLEKSEIHGEEFDGVMVCSGHHTTPHLPEPFPGQDKFKGKIMHSHDYKAPKGFEEQTVVVVGIGNSGGDVAVELSKITKKVYLSTRSGSWIMNRVWDCGEPSDLAFLNRFSYSLKKILPFGFQNWMLERKVNSRFDHGRFGLQPSHRFLEAHVTVNDELPNRIISGTVVVKPNIERFTETGVVFDDGTEAENVDTVIFATGFSFSFPQIENGSLLKVVQNKVNLYELMFLPELSPKNTLAIIGLIQPTGSIMPISELQTRVFCGQLSGETPALPGKEEMIKIMERRNKMNEKQFIDRPRHTIQVDYVIYMDELAELINVKPDLFKYAMKDFQLAKKLYFHGLVPYQYRLQGPHSWDGARAAILGFEDRVFEATRTRRTPETMKSKPISKFYQLRLLQ
uniref:Flavin-containing monooxygenase n=1 Tax=Steinernema glaseri TaxID=37863 RepID=A0A1I7XX52_9BILA